MSPRFVTVTLLALCAPVLVSPPIVFASGARRGSAVAAALFGTPADGDIGLRVSAAPFKGPGRDASVVLVVDLDPSNLDLHETQGRYVGGLRVGYVATDTRGRTRNGTVYDGAVVLGQADYERAFEDGLRLRARIELPEGRYQLRVTAGTATRAGSILQELEVPGFSGRLTMSGIAISSASAAGGVALPAAPLMRLSTVAPTAGREFESDDTLTLFTEVYESSRRLREGPTQGGSPSDPDYRELGDHTIHVFAELRTRDGSILMTTAGARAGGGEQVAGTHAFLTRLPLVGVPEGRYIIRVKARANIGEPDTVSRDIPIRVR